MTPVLDTGFAERCRALVPRFRATETLPARKSELLAGEIDGVAVVAKRLVRDNDVWAWYLAREIAIYRAFAADPPPVRVPKLVLASDDVLIVERMAGAPLATRRSPQAVLDERVLWELFSIRERFASYKGKLPTAPPPPAVRSQLRSRFLEDPTDPVEWIRDGIARAASRKILPSDAAASIVVMLTGHDEVVPSHGDLLLRNAIGYGAKVGLVDWECAGMHHTDWDLALLWTQLAPEQRPFVETGRSPAFLGVVAFALAREISFVHAFRPGPRHNNLARLNRELEQVCDRIR